MNALLLQTGAALAFVLLLIGAAAWIYKKRRPGSPGLMDLVAYQPFGPRRGVAAVRVGREVLIVGVTNSDLKLFRVVRSEEFLGSAGPPPTDRLGRLRKINEGLDA